MTTITCRLIFCAKITDCDNVAQMFNNVIAEKFPQRITGLFLIYSDFVIHLIEAPEDDVFRLCREVFTVNSEIMTNIKCLYIQSDAKRRFFEKWHFRKMRDVTSNNDKLEQFEDNFGNISSIYKTIIQNLFTLYIELYNTWQSKGYESLIEFLDTISIKGNVNIPSRSNVEFVLESCWGYNLATLVKEYFNFTYASNFDDYSSVSEIIQETVFNCKE